MYQITIIGVKYEEVMSISCAGLLELQWLQPLEPKGVSKTEDPSFHDPGLVGFLHTCTGLAPSTTLTCHMKGVPE